MSIKKSNYSKDIFFMRLALMEAKKNLGNTKSNPSVGCVIVKNNCVISSSHTSDSGRPHAEHNAIKLSKESLKYSKMYVTLEPCSHFGVTSPCVNRIINSKIDKVYFSIKDIDARSKGKSLKKLRKNKIKVNCGIYSSEIKNFYRSYIKNRQKNLPYVTSKIAISKDFFTKNKKNKWITNEHSRGRVHLLRAKDDCIITSSKTIIDDNPDLGCRIFGLEYRSPVKIILDQKLRTPINSKIIKLAKKKKIIIFFNKINKNKIKILRKFNIKLIHVSLDESGDFNLRNILAKIKKIGFNRIFIEAGVNLNTKFFMKNLIDDLYLFISKSSIGRNGSLSFKKISDTYLKNKSFVDQKINLYGDKLLLYKIK